MSECHMCAWYLQKPEEGIWYPGDGATHSCELPWLCLESNPGPLEAQAVLFVTETLLQLPDLILNKVSGGDVIDRLQLTYSQAGLSQHAAAET